MIGIPWLLMRVMRLPQEARVASMKHWLENLAELGFETYYPMVREMRPVPRKRMSHAQRTSGVIIMRPAKVPFLPQLVFVRATGRTDRLVEHPGVVGFIADGDRPARISDALVVNLRERERLGEGGAIPGGTLAEWIFKVGDAVEIINGAFAMYRGIVDELPNVPIERIDAETRLKLTVAIFGRQTAVNVAVSDVRKA